MSSQMNTRQTKARPNKKTAESAGNNSAMKRNQNIYNDVPVFLSPVASRKSLRLPTNRWSNIPGKNNLRGVTLVLSLET